MAALNVEVKQEVMATLIEDIVINMRGLVEEHLLAGSLNRGHHLLVAVLQIVHVELLLLDEEEAGADTNRRVPLSLELENVHALVITRCEVVKSGMRCHDPVAISVFASRVDAQATLHVPEPHGAILRVGQ